MRSGRPALSLCAATLAALACAGSAVAAPSVRSDGPTVRYADSSVRDRTTTIRGTLIELSHGDQRYLMERQDGDLVPVDFAGVELPETARNAPATVERAADGDVRSATLSARAAPAGRAATPHRAYVAKVTNLGATTERPTRTSRRPSAPH